MGDSDDDFDTRRNRDKFRRERDDFGGSRVAGNRGGDWSDGRDRSGQYRRQYPGSGGLSGGREFVPRYNRSPGRYDTSPSHNKRPRRDWDGPDPSSSHFDPSGGANYYHGGGNFHSNFSGNAHAGAGGGEQFNKDSSDGATQPPMLSFKNFLHDQEDNIDQEEAVKRYSEYKTEFKKTQIAEFFNAHKDDEWFKYKYYPDEYPKRREEQRNAVKRRLDVFMELYNKGYLDDVSVDSDGIRSLTRFLDAVVIKLEGGNDYDLRALDTENSVSNTTVDNEDVDPEANKSSNNATEAVASEQTSSGAAGSTTTSDEPSQSKKESETKRKREGSVSDDGAVSDGGDDDEQPKDKKTNGKVETSTENESSMKKKPEVKSTTNDNEPEAGEVPDAPRGLHRTSSIFFRHLPMQTTKEDLENLCKQYAGFRRVFISDPAPERKFTRRGWATFDQTHEIRRMCYELNSTKLHDVDIGAMLNRELKNRMRVINGIGQHKTIVRNDLRLVSKIIKQYDDRWSLWEPSDSELPEKKSAETPNDDSEISSSTAATVTSPSKPKKPMGFVSQNPLLKNITDYLVEETDAEEEELLGDSSGHPGDSTAFEVDKELTKVLDRLILYVRVVHSVDYYNGTDYPQEDSMPNRCGAIHVRGPPLSSITSNELTNFMHQFEARLKPFIEFRDKLDEDEAIKLGLKKEADEIEKFINANCQEVSKDKWSCPLSGKKFKGPEFVRKHILNKHQEKLDEVKRNVIFFNNYLYDPKRPQLPEHPSNRPGLTPTGSHPSGLPLPTPSGPMGGQGLFNRPAMWPQMSAPPHSGPPAHFYNPYHQPRQIRPSGMYPGPGGPINRPPMNRPLRSYEDLDAPNETI